MKFLLNLFTPETWAAFLDHGATVSGFPISMRTRAQNIAAAGDIFVCYMVKVSRWCGVLRIVDGPYIDETPIFRSQGDPYVVRFKVDPLVLLSDEVTVPITAPEVWSHLSFTRNMDVTNPGPGWAYKAKVASSLVQIAKADGEFLAELLKKQKATPRQFPFDTEDRRKLAAKATTVKTATGERDVEIPEDSPMDDGIAVAATGADERESIKVQALICKIGALMKYDIWVPRNDRARVQAELPTDFHRAFINLLPFNYNDATLRTIEHIDVLWLRRRSIVRAFEVEGTTAVYSGLLRMADLLALQPDLRIQLHIVAPDERGDKVMRELKRPVFLYLEGGALSDSCSFITYSRIRELAGQPHLEYMNSEIVNEYELRVEDSV